MTSEELFWRRAIVSASAIIYWVGVWILARRVRKQIGRSPNLKPRGPKEKLLWVGWLLVILVWVGQSLVVKIEHGWPGVDLFPTMLNQPSLVAGSALVVVGYAATLWCYAAMGNTWRIGVNANEKTTLVERGPYRVIRHPIYAFQLVMLAGAALLLPTALSFAILAIHLVCALIKAVDEENYLKTVHGQTYTDYMARTGRLIPRLFRRASPLGGSK
ncbi:MAG: isoprenylcysteine carboxylmethyltransferase family protein [Verrucomicrobiota bacterium]